MGGNQGHLHQKRLSQCQCVQQKSQLLVAVVLGGEVKLQVSHSSFPNVILNGDILVLSAETVPGFVLAILEYNKECEF